MSHKIDSSLRALMWAKKSAEDLGFLHAFNDCDNCESMMDDDLKASYAKGFKEGANHPFNSSETFHE